MKLLALAILLASSLIAIRRRAQEEAPPASEPVSQPAPEAATQPATDSASPPTAASDAAPSPTTETAPASIELLSYEELSALGIDADSPTVDKTLRLGGFADFGFGATLNRKESYWRGSGIVPASPSFYVGNLNLYLDKYLTETIRTMFEIRFSFLPNGSRSYGFEAREDTETSDYVDFGRFTRWGGIIIQRAYVEWSPLPLLTIRGGQFLTPYGIWNVDHGSPVYIPIRRPYTLSNQYFPEKQTGLELYGRTDLSPENAIGYHLTLSNGQGPISEYTDLDANKALGGRLFWELHALGRWRIGGSTYYGRFTDLEFLSEFVGESVESSERILTQYDKLSWAVDLTWDLGDLHVQGEWLFTERAYTEKGRTQREAEIGTLIPSDVSTLGGYGLAGYRLPWFGIMPYLVLEYSAGGLEDLNVTVWILQVGLNIRPVDELVLKLSFERLDLEGDLIEPLQTISSQVAWAF